MVAEREGRASLTAEEAAVMRTLLEHDGDDVEVETGPRTEVYERRSWHRPGPSTLSTVVAVELAAARRLAKLPPKGPGFVTIDAGGLCHLTDVGRAAAAG